MASPVPQPICSRPKSWWLAAPSPVLPLHSQRHRFAVRSEVQHMAEARLIHRHDTSSLTRNRQLRDSGRSPFPFLGPGQDLVHSEQVLQLQRTVGNKGVGRLLAHRSTLPVQGAFEMKTSHFDQQIGMTDTFMNMFGKSIFYNIRNTLASYEKAASPNRLKLLDKLENLCSKWMVAHGTSKSAGDLKKKAVVQNLLDEVDAERASVASKQAAEGIYLANAVNVGKKDPNSSDIGKKYALEALSRDGMGAAEKASIGQYSNAEASLMSAHGVTGAEIAAIKTFTASDYQYINPATANSESWLTSNRKQFHLSAKLGDRTFSQEGSLHTAIAMQGLTKMPAWTKPAYRGERCTPTQFGEKYSVGKEFSYNSFASSAQEERVALNFAHGLADSPPSLDKSVAVLAVLEETGGRDISSISMVQGEKEVLLLPGSKFVVKKVEEVDGNTAYARYVTRARQAKIPIPDKWYVVTMAPATKSGGK